MAIGARETGPVDKHVGERVRMRRIMMKMSQTELAEKLGITFQQVQKYEKGTNRIGAGRLHRISQILDVPITYFFEDVPGQKSGSGRNAALPDYLVKFMGTSQGQRVVQGLASISDRKILNHVMELVDSIADSAAAPKKRGRG
jgi:transcriptional regulator with XRE-family HTH domain